MLSTEQTVTPPVLWQLKQYPFNPPPKPRHSDDDLRIQLGAEEYNRIVANRIEKKPRWGIQLSPEDNKFLREREGGGESGK